MASLRNRSDYLDDYTPGEVSSLLGGNRYTKFSSSPGNLGNLAGSTQRSLVGRIFDRLSDFESKEKFPGNNFQKFLSLYQNPNKLVEDKMKVPVGFNQAYGLSSLF